MKGKIRESNIELLRILAMFLVLLVHIDFFALGAPNSTAIVQNTEDSVLRVLFQSLSIACVDIFVIISGWFGINANLKGFLNFVFQCLFFLIGIYLICLLLGFADFSKEGILGCFALTQLNWFIKAYLLLYIISPVLNSFVKNSSQRDFRNVLIGFYLFQMVYGWIFSASTLHIVNGYSTISFVGLYLLARYTHIYKPNLIFLRANRCFANVLLLSLIVTFCYICPPPIGL